MESDPAICSQGDLSTELVAEPIGAFSVEMLILEASMGARLPARSGSQTPRRGSTHEYLAESSNYALKEADACYG